LRKPWNYLSSITSKRYTNSRKIEVHEAPSTIGLIRRERWAGKDREGHRLHGAETLLPSDLKMLSRAMSFRIYL
jgi:hypothetical protein